MKDVARSIAVKRVAAMAATFMVGDGLLGLLQPERHVALWRSRLPAIDILVREFDGKPGRRRLYGMVQIAAGLALAAQLKAPRKG